MRTSTFSCVLLAALAFMGCRKAEPPPAEATHAAASKTASVAGKDDADRVLALAETGGTAAVDTALAAMRGAAVKNPRKADLWIALGRAWIRKARESSDPGFYLHADACARIAEDMTERKRIVVVVGAVVRDDDAGHVRSSLVGICTKDRPSDPLVQVQFVIRGIS